MYIGDTNNVHCTVRLRCKFASVMSRYMYLCIIMSLILHVCSLFGINYVISGLRGSHTGTAFGSACVYSENNWHLFIIHKGPRFTHRFLDRFLNRPSAVHWPRIVGLFVRLQPDNKWPGRAAAEPGLKTALDKQMDSLVWAPWMESYQFYFTHDHVTTMSIALLAYNVMYIYCKCQGPGHSWNRLL